MDNHIREIKTSKNGVNYLHGVLFEKTLVMGRIALYEIPHNNPSNNEIAIKIGRYKKKKGPFNLSFEEIESSQPKSEVTLKGEEFENLISFLETHYEPFQRGTQKFIPLDGPIQKDNIEHIQAFFNHPEKQELIEFILNNDVIPEELFTSFNHLKKRRAVEEFDQMLEEDLTEHKWQAWFQQNSWVLGTDFVKVLDERNLDTQNISDFLMEAYDGFIDIIEIKRPDGNLKFWNDVKDHGNFVPHSDLIKAITQASKYIYEIEREANSVKFLERVGYTKTIKPRCILIFGRSDDWNDEQKESYRILNSSYHNLTIMTYDHVLERAKRIVQ